MRRPSTRYPHLEHPLSHGRVDLKEIIQSSLPVAKASQNDFRDPPFWTIRQWLFFLEPREKCSKDYINTFWEILDIHQVVVGYSASGPQQEPVYLNFLAVKRSRLRGPPVCRIPHCIAESPEIFQLKTLPNRLEMGSNQHSCHLFRRKSCSSVRVKKDVLCPAGWLEQRSISILEMQTPNFHNSDGGSIPRHLTVRWNPLWIFILTQLHSAS